MTIILALLANKKCVVRYVFTLEHVFRLVSADIEIPEMSIRTT